MAKKHDEKFKAKESDWLLTMSMITPRNGCASAQ